MELGKSPTQEKVILILRNGPMKATAILKHIQANPATSITKQGFYLALRKLKEEEVVVVYRGTVALNTRWIQNVQDLVSDMATSYLQSEASSPLTLGENEYASYSFSTIPNLDAFWGHIQSILIAHTAQNEAIYVYDPHYWFYLARKETETQLLKKIVASERQFLMTVGGTTGLDLYIKKDFNSDYLQYYSKPLFKQKNYYVTVVGDYLIEVFLDKDLAEKVDEVYANAKVLDKDVMSKFAQILSTEARSKIKISHNHKRATQMKNILKKSFFVKTA